ncbi:MAG TPA: DUF4387 domain-containing protein [Candidatus Dormibacteraeota bacterium]|jgi:hypothetical protein|nr:DUF4387 domain-containing protein [Candidatus Dormibacteraeota bacterium]
MTVVPLAELASTVRSKNAGVLHVTFDVLFRDHRAYGLAKASGALSRERLAALYGLEPEQIVTWVFYDPGLAFKFTIRRRQPAGTPGEPDPFGSQLYPPLFDVQIPVASMEGDER